VNDAGIDLLKDFEGFRERAYLDVVGVPTIGYGFTKGVQLGDHMTQAEGQERLKTEIAEFEGGVITACTRLPSPNQLAALVCLAYNIGINAFRKSTVLRLHNAGDFTGAADAFRMWCKAGPRVVTGLVNRREAERALYLTPDTERRAKP